VLLVWAWQFVWIGQCGQLGFVFVHKVAPRSIMAWVYAAFLFCGRSFSAFCQRVLWFFGVPGQPLIW